VIYVEYQDATSQAPNPPEAWRGIGWWAVCDDCVWSSGPHHEHDDAIREADQHALALEEVTREELGRRSSVERMALAWSVCHGWRPDGWWFVVEVPGQPREEHGPFTSEPAMLAAKVARMQELEADPTERPAEAGERCTCGRQAVVVYLGSAFGPTGYCGIADGGDQTGQCPFCGGPRHETAYGDPGRCPDYRLRLDPQ
jgi:hypothetical protein